MNSLNAFILLELFTIRCLKKFDNKILSDFRHIVKKYLCNSSSYDEFIILLSSNSLYYDKKIFTLCLSFKNYLKNANKIWQGNELTFGYCDRFSYYKVPKI